MQSKCCTISSPSHRTGVNQDNREESYSFYHREAQTTTFESAEKMYRQKAERMQLKYSKAKRKKIRTFSVGNFVSVKIPRIDRTCTDLLHFTG